ncbi:MAG: hypothetical protein ACRD10_03190 [Terriglobia bacterium]
MERCNHILNLISGLSSYVHDALVVLAGGGVSIPQIRSGAECVRMLHRAMDQSRTERLQSLGFSVDEASTMPA